MQSINRKLADARAKLESDVEAWKAEGHTIYQATHEDSKMYRDRMAKHGPYVPMTVAEARMNHRWHIPHRG